MGIPRSFLFAGTIVSAVVMAAYPAIGSDYLLGLQLRGAQPKKYTPLTKKIIDAPDWALRKSRADNLSQSLLFDGQPEHVEGQALSNFLRTSLDRSDALHSSIHQANAAHYTARAEVSRLLPTVSLRAEVSKDHSIRRLTGTNGGIKTKTAEITANWTIFSSGANWSAINAANLDAQVADLRFLAAERQVFVENSGIYLQLVASRQVVSAISRTYGRLRKIRNSVGRLYDGGLASKSDVAQVDAELASVAVQLESAKSSFAQQKTDFRLRAGYDAPKKLRAPKTAHLIPATVDQALERALDRNHTVSAAYLNQSATAARSKSIMGQYLPQVSLFATGSTNEFNYEAAEENHDWSIGARLTVPLVDFAAMPRYQQSREEAFAARYQATDTEVQVRRDVETTWTSYQSLKRQRASLQKQANAIKRSLVGIGKQYRAGLRPVSDLLREEIRLTENSIELARNQFQINASAYRIAAQFSDLSISDITPI